MCGLYYGEDRTDATQNSVARAYPVSTRITVDYPNFRLFRHSFAKRLSFSLTPLLAPARAAIPRESADPCNRGIRAHGSAAGTAPG